MNNIDFSLKKAVFLGFLLCLVLPVMAQRPIDLASRAMSAGNYADAITYFRKAYEIDPSDEITKQLNLAQSLKTEFDAIDEAIKKNDSNSFESHVNNVLMIDPGNKFIEQKRKMMKNAISAENQKNRKRKWNKFSYGFNGDWDKHDGMGGVHFQVGGAFVKSWNLNYKPALHMNLYYSNFKHFPFTIDGTILYNKEYSSLGLGLGSSYAFSDKFAINYGVGYQWNFYRIELITEEFDWLKSRNFYYRVGFSYMFNNDYLGGIGYSYNHSINGKDNPYPVSYHTINYIMGKSTSAYVAVLAFLVGLGVTSSLLKK